MNQLLSTDWTVDRKLDVKEREALFILAESAGLSVYPRVRDHSCFPDWPYVCKGSDADISARGRIPKDDSKIFSYKEIITILKKMVKEREVPEYE